MLSSSSVRIQFDVASAVMRCQNSTAGAALSTSGSFPLCIEQCGTVMIVMAVDNARGTESRPHHAALAYIGARREA